MTFSGTDGLPGCGGGGVFSGTGGGLLRPVSKLDQEKDCRSLLGNRTYAVGSSAWIRSAGRLRFCVDFVPYSGAETCGRSGR